MIRTDRAHLNVVAQTHEGMTGKNNEDRYAVTSYRLSKTNATPVLFAVVADGIGGHRAGEVAAELAVDHISEVVADSDARNPKKTLEKAIHVASEAIADHAATVAEKQGMGATCACVMIVGDRLYAASVGDTRIYLLREKQIQQLTTDHTWVQEAIEKGVLTPEMARDHPNVHVIRRYLGSPEPPEVDFRLRLFESESDAFAEGNQGMQLRPNDRLLLCSDGLTDLVGNAEIAETVYQNDSLMGAAKALVDLANDRGGHDNTTVALISVPGEFRQSFPKRKNWWPWILGAGVAIILLVTLAMVLGANLIRLTLVSTPTPTPSATVTLTVNPNPKRTLTPITTPMEIVETETDAMEARESTYTPWPTNTTRGPAETETPSP